MKVSFRKIKGFLFRHKISVSIIVIAVLVASAATIYGLSYGTKFVAGPLKLTEKPKPTGVEAPLTGLLVDDAHANRRALGVVVENHPDARPQSGYNEADVVYETLAEGGITRTLAVFQSQDSKEIGPVRSARQYFIDWISEYSGVFAHVGGASGALSFIVANKIPDLNQFAFGSYFWRSTDRYAPHNVYTTTDKLYAAAKSAGYSIVGAPKPFSFKVEPKESDRGASQLVTIDFSYSDFQVKYTFVPKTNTYLRAVAGVAAKDKNTGIQIAPKNVIVQFTSEVPFTEDGVQGVRITTIGSGKGIFFQDGKAIAVTWSKSSLNARTVFTDTATGKEVQFNRGQTWVEVVPTGNSVTY